MEKYEEFTIGKKISCSWVRSHRGQGSYAEEIIFTEEQYHSAMEDVYSWSNLVQIQHMSSSVGMMIGLSLTDRNMRRLLDAIRKTPIRSENYGLLKKPEWTKPTKQQIRKIDVKAQDSILVL